MKPHSHSLLLISLSLMLLFFSKHSCKNEAKPLSGGGVHVPATNISVEFLDPTLPPALPPKTPKCSVIVFQHEFSMAAADIGSVPVASANYTQPADCPAPWMRVVLELSMSVSVNAQKDRVAAVWINGGEVLRTSIPSPNLVSASWKVHKDVTRYTALLRRLQGGAYITMTLEENSGATIYGGGMYKANVSLHFFRGSLSESSALDLPVTISYVASPSVKGIYRHPADLIVPVSKAGDNGLWFNVTKSSPVSTTAVSIPRNTYRAVLEIFASYHAEDELWYMNPLQSSCIIGAAGGSKFNGGLRQIYATIDGRFVGGRIPFAVIYPTSINPYFWWPVTSIGAFDMPSYSLELTPLLELLLDGQPHEVGFGVKNGLDYWLLSANLHLWVDEWSDVVQAGLVDYRAPPLTVTQQAEWHNEDGGSEVNAEGLLRFIGWVSSSSGNVTTMVRQKVTFKSQVEVQNRGAVRQVELINKERMAIGMRSGHNVLGRVQMFIEAPLQIQKVAVREGGGGPLPPGGAAVYEEKTRLFHQLDEMLNLNDRMVVTTSMMTDRQNAEGTSMVGGDGTAVWGSGKTRSTYKYRDEDTCYLRRVDADGGMVKVDDTSPSCSGVADQ